MANDLQDQPLCPEGDFRFWMIVGAVALGVQVVGCLLGAPALFPTRFPEISLIQRLSTSGATIAWIALCTFSGSFAFAAIALVRGRPSGNAVDIVGRVFACVAIASLARFVPISEPFLKAAFNGAALALAGAMLARSAFRITTLDALAAAAVASGFLGAIAAAAFVTTWAIHP